jgi:hypothetical protein
VNAPNILLQAIVIAGAIVVMLYGLNIVYKRIKAKKQGFGPNTLKAVGVVLLIPTILIMGVFAQFQAETLAALLGTVAGYVLSNSKAED